MFGNCLAWEGALDGKCRWEDRSGVEASSVCGDWQWQCHGLQTTTACTGEWQEGRRELHELAALSDHSCKIELIDCLCLSFPQQHNIHIHAPACHTASAHHQVHTSPCSALRACVWCGVLSAHSSLRSRALGCLYTRRWLGQDKIGLSTAAASHARARGRRCVQISDCFCRLDRPVLQAEVRGCLYRMPLLCNVLTRIWLAILHRAELEASYLEGLEKVGRYGQACENVKDVLYLLPRLWSLFHLDPGKARRERPQG